MVLMTTVDLHHLVTTGHEAPAQDRCCMAGANDNNLFMSG
jgi:hypothetical protein